jgi:hypothetical protein
VGGVALTIGRSDIILLLAGSSCKDRWGREGHRGRCRHIVQIGHVAEPKNGEVLT